MTVPIAHVDVIEGKQIAKLLGRFTFRGIADFPEESGFPFETCPAVMTACRLVCEVMFDELVII